MITKMGKKVLIKKAFSAGDFLITDPIPSFRFNALCKLGEALYIHACKANRADRAKASVDYLEKMGVFNK